MDFAPLNNQYLQHNHHHQQHDHNPSSYQVWNNFFLKAGIPGNVANEYAITFSQHRIRIDMLKEITKEILLDMGIKAMGDIIAILRHAKDICTQDELKTGAFSAPKSNNPTGSTNTSSSSNHHNVISPRQTMANHLSRKASISTSKSTSLNAGATSSGVSNKVQSQVSLNSGALIASSNNLVSQHEFLGTEASSKRFSLTTNPTAKRLRTGSTTGPQKNTILHEKTLTVHYPSTSAIERAQQRLGLTTNSIQSSSSMSTKNPIQIPIKSRLGQSPHGVSSHSKAGLVSSSSSTTNNGRIGNHNKTWSSVVKNNNVESRISQTRPSSRSPNSTSTYRGGQNWKNKKGKQNPKHEPRRLKSAVFSRLGESAR